jgi:CheY-like chemotaxis protein
VLVVDDNSTNRRILQDMLRHWGAAPVLAESGREALAAMQQAVDAGKPFGLVLLDNMMPEMDGFMLAEEIQRQPGLAGATLMMLSSADRRDNAARCRALGVAAYLTKPIKRTELLRALLTVISGPASAPASTTVAPRRAIGHGPRRLHLLLTEDNAVNQQLAVRLLEKRGHSVVVAGNGREALVALARARYRFDVVLMDVQMPEMDGFEATRLIRLREQVMGGHVPIVAMTAHAMKGDRERCLHEGMDGYISKPLQPTELFEVVENLAASAAPARESPAPAQDMAPVRDAAPAQDVAPVQDMAPVFDEKSALGSVGGDRELLNEIIDVYLAECPRWMTELSAAVTRGEAATVKRMAHTFKGTMGTFGAAEAGALAQRLEDMGRDGGLQGAAEAFAALAGALARLKPALAAFRENKSARNE